MRNNSPDWSAGLGKKPPQDLLSERSVIAACLNGHFEEVASVLKTHEVFYKEQHMILFEAFQKINRDGKDITPLQIRRTIPHQIEIIGGMLALDEMREADYHLTDIRNDCVHLIEMYISRQVIAVSTNLIKEAFSVNATDPFLLVQQMEQLSEDVTRTISELKTFDFQKEKEDAIEETKKRHEGLGDLVLQTKISRVDETIGGLERGSLITVAGRPAMGKTCVGIQLVYNVGFIQKIPVALFTLEMSSRSIINRLLANHTNFSNFEIKAGFKGAENRLNDFIQRSESFSSEHIHIYDQIFQIDSIVAKSKELIKNKGVQLILIDYLQLAEAPEKGNREQEVSYMSRQLKKLALEGNVPVIQFAQLSRAVETRGGDKRPQLSDLRESGSIEQDSDNVVFLHRPYYYNKEADFHELTWINGKNRNGSNEDAKLYCDIPYNQIRDHKVDFNIPTAQPIARNEHQVLRQLMAFSDDLDDTPF